MTNKKESLYLALEGGGAKGIAHVGVLHATEEPSLNVELKGIAGTSAGSIVAALRASGYTASEIFSLDGTTHILQKLSTSPQRAHGLLGRAAWSRLAAIRWFARHRQLTLPITILLLLFYVGWLFPPTTWLKVAVLFLTGLLVWRSWRRVTGITTLRELRGHIGALLDAKCPAHSNVTFRQAQSAGWLPLKIIVSDLTHRRLAVFSAEDTPNVAVADAVMASIAIPIIFEPWHIQYENEADAPEWVRSGRDSCDYPVITTHADGGMIANLPAWAFEAERAIDRDSTLLAIELTGISRTKTTKALTGLELLSSLAHTAIFGAGEISKKASGRKLINTLDAIRKNRRPLGVLDFDAPLDDFTFIAQSACELTKSMLVSTLTLELSAFRELVSRVHAALRDALILGSIGIQVLDNESPTVRVSVVAVPSDSDHPDGLTERLRGVQCATGANIGAILPGSMLPHIQSLVRALTTNLVPAMIHSAVLYRPRQDETVQAPILINDPSWPELQWAFAFPTEVNDRTWAIVVESSNGPYDPKTTAALLDALVTVETVDALETA